MSEKNIWKTRPNDDYHFGHIVKILRERDGWIRIPCFTGKEELHEVKWWDKIPHGPCMGE